MSATAPSTPPRPVVDPAARRDLSLATIRVRRFQQRQASRREAEQQRRRGVVAIAACCRRHAPWRQVAEAVGVPERTLRAWRAESVGVPSSRGRRPLGVPQPQRQQILRFLRHVTGPAVGLPTLRALFPRVPRAVLADLLRRFRRVWRRRLRQPSVRLEWHEPGRVWAMDHTEATQLIDGQDDQIFAVRDLASHAQLAWRGVSSTGAAATCEILESLLLEHGPPLVLKSDNGSAFVSASMSQLLSRWGVTPLFSPKRRPRYNGALERANSTHKTYTHHHAETAGHPYFWTSADLEQARRVANRITRPWGHTGPSPDEAWRDRAPITADERDRFIQAVAEQEVVARGELGLGSNDEPTAKQHERLARRAISGALESLGYLTKHALTRAPSRRRRLSRTQLQRALKRHREALPPDALDGEETETSAERILACFARRDRIQQGAGAASIVSTAPRSPPTRAESAHHSLWRRAFTLVIRFAKAAKIMG